MFCHEGSCYHCESKILFGGKTFLEPSVEHGDFVRLCMHKIVNASRRTTEEGQLVRSKLSEEKSISVRLAAEQDLDDQMVV